MAAIAALGAMALGASGAQGASFEVNGSTANLLALLFGDQEGESTLLVPARNLSIECMSGGTEPTSEITDKTKGLIRFRFTLCSAFPHVLPSKELHCTVSPFEIKAIVLPVVNSGIPYVLFEPDGGEQLTTVMLTGAECPLPEVNPVKGTTIGRVWLNESKEILVETSETISKTLGSDALTFGVAAAFLSVDMKLKLTGPHVAMKFGVV